jgi:hypothetical protein
VGGLRTITMMLIAMITMMMMMGGERHRQGNL